MSILESAGALIVRNAPLSYWLIAFLATGFLVTAGRGFLQARKIQPNGFNWRIFRHEILLGAVNLLVTGFLLGGLSSWLRAQGFISFNSEAASGWVTALEFTLYFFAFDTYFYWLHRFMHLKRVYPWTHKLHHRSISPNLLTTLSVSPVESLINGGFVPLFTAALTMHDSSMALIGPCNIIMGLYVHSGYEFLPRWWNKTWLTKWFITTTFHDQHHRFFRGNYGGYTSIWDRICGTIRPTYAADFDRIVSRRQATRQQPAAELA